MVRLPLLLFSAAAVVSADPLLEFLHVADSLYKINTHNANSHRTYNMTYYDDLSALTPEQFKKRLGLRMPAVLPNTSDYKVNENFKAPESFDWRDSDSPRVVSPVKDQKSCGSCWAFSAVGALEGQHARKRGALVQFSEQNLVDCSGEFHNDGCDGGTPDNAYEYVKANGGIDTEDAYPYEGIDDTCQFNKDSVGETDKGFVDLPSTDEEALKNAVAEIGPISVGVQCRMETWRHYREGVFYDAECSDDPQLLNHAVLVVGYGTDPEHGDYWLVKNSWGVGWGEKGYIRMARNKDNNCGISTAASYPIVE